MTQPGPVLLTGATGFVGRCVLTHLLRQGMQVHAAVRRASALSASAPNLRLFQGLELDQDTDWSAALQGVSTVIHCAARVHMMRDAAADPLAVFRKVNVAGTVRLAEQAAQMGVRRFVYVSSIKVNGESTTGQAFRADDAPQPHGPYAQSKLEAERALADLSRRSGLEVTVVRPPLVYGPGAPGNFATMLKVLRQGWPLPFGSVNNRRSLVALDNLASLLVLCAQHPAAAGQVFLVSDGEDLSTAMLLRRIGQAMGRSPRLFAVPPGLFSAVAGLLGREAAVQRLLGSLQVDIAKTRQLLGWAPVVSVDQALLQAVQVAPALDATAPAARGPGPTP